MPATDTLRSFILADPRFYEPLGSAPLGDDLARRVRDEIGSQGELTTSGIWFRCRPSGIDPLPDHGWKIHISSTPGDAAKAAGIVCDEYRATPFFFKILRDTHLVTASTARWWPRGSAGKVITVYSHTPRECQQLLERFTAAFEPVSGPYVLSDRRYGTTGVVHYRYGEFKPTRRVRPDGRTQAVLHGPDGERWPDLRLPAFRLPPWAGDPFARQPAADAAAPSARPLDRYRIVQPLHQTTAGGVYLAEDLTTGQQVVLKEARPNTAFSLDGSDAVDRLRREFDTLRLVADTGIGPQPVELVKAWEHLFLAEERIEGLTLRAFVARRNPLAQGDTSPAAIAAYRDEAHAVLAGVRAAVQTCHQLGIVHGDLSPTNIIVDPDTLRVRLVDFEASRPLSARHELYPRTPGFSPADGSAAMTSGELFDEAGLAGTELALLFPRNDLIQLNGAALVRSTRHAAALLNWPLGDVFERLGVADTESGSAQLTVEPGSLREVIDNGVRFILGTMTPGRADRLFPADPAVYTANSFGLAHGAAGVIRTLHRLTGQVPQAARDWLDHRLPDADELPPGLHFGWSGIALMFLETGETARGCALLDRVIADLGEVSSDVATGLAGIGSACLEAWLRTGADRYRDAAVRAGRQLVRAARDDGSGLHWPDPDAPGATVGYASGSSGVATFLLYLHCAVERADGRQEFLRVGRRALQFDLSKAKPRQTGIGFPGRIGARPLEPYWSRGAAGVGTAVLRYLLVTGEEQLPTLLGQLMPPTLGGLAINPGLFTGMAGIANLALDHDHLLGGDRYRDRADALAAAILTLGCPQPEGLAFPGNSLLRYSVDYATGSAGILLLLDRLASGGPDFSQNLDKLLPDPAVEGGAIQHG